MTEQLDPRAAKAIPGRVAAGAAWLDEHYPGWPRKVAITRLDMSKGCRCVLGFVGTPSRLRRALNRISGWDYIVRGRTRERFLSYSRALDLGFDRRTESATAEYEALRAEWVRVIRERRAAA